MAGRALFDGDIRWRYEGEQRFQETRACKRCGRTDGALEYVYDGHTPKEQRELDVIYVCVPRCRFGAQAALATAAINITVPMPAPKELFINGRKYVPKPGASAIAPTGTVADLLLPHHVMIDSVFFDGQEYVPEGDA